MAWTAMGVRATGDLINAAIWASDLKGNIEYLKGLGGAITIEDNMGFGGTKKVTGLAAASGNGEALRYEQLIGLYLLLAGGDMAGAINLANAISLAGKEAGGTARSLIQMDASDYIRIGVAGLNSAYIDIQDTKLFTVRSQEEGNTLFQAAGDGNVYSPLIPAV